jgi:hypothetical protein
MSASEPISARSAPGPHLGATDLPQFGHPSTMTPEVGRRIGVRGHRCENSRQEGSGRPLPHCS